MKTHTDSQSFYQSLGSTSLCCQISLLSLVLATSKLGLAVQHVIERCCHFNYKHTTQVLAGMLQLIYLEVPPKYTHGHDVIPDYSFAHI